MSSFNFTKDELSLICRSLSDSMNYDSDRFFEKWVLLLKVKKYEILENNGE